MTVGVLLAPEKFIVTSPTFSEPEIVTMPAGGAVGLGPGVDVLPPPTLMTTVMKLPKGCPLAFCMRQVPVYVPLVVGAVRLTAITD